MEKKQPNVLLPNLTTAATKPLSCPFFANFDSCVYQSISYIKIALRNLHRGKGDTRQDSCIFSFHLLQTGDNEAYQF